MRPADDAGRAARVVATPSFVAAEAGIVESDALVAGREGRAKSRAGVGLAGAGAEARPSYSAALALDSDAGFGAGTGVASRRAAWCSRASVDSGVSIAAVRFEPSGKSAISAARIASALWKRSAGSKRRAW